LLVTVHDQGQYRPQEKPFWEWTCLGMYGPMILSLHLPVPSDLEQGHCCRRHRPERHSGREAGREIDVSEPAQFLAWQGPCKQLGKKDAADTCPPQAPNISQAQSAEQFSESTVI
jgi:hypothetical protein